MQAPTPTEIEQAEAAIAEYNAAYAAGGELEYPQWAADLLKQAINDQQTQRSGE